MMAASPTCWWRVWGAGSSSSSTCRRRDATLDRLSSRVSQREGLGEGEDLFPLPTNVPLGASQGVTLQWVLAGV